MYVPSCVSGDLLVADQATTFLPTPKFPELTAELACRRTLFTRFEVRFPFRVVGIRFRPDFDVPPNRNVADFHQAFPSRCSVDALLAYREHPYRFGPSLSASLARSG